MLRYAGVELWRHQHSMNLGRVQLGPQFIQHLEELGRLLAREFESFWLGEFHPERPRNRYEDRHENDEKLDGEKLQAQDRHRECYDDGQQGQEGECQEQVAQRRPREYAPFVAFGVRARIRLEPRDLGFEDRFIHEARLPGVRLACAALRALRTYCAPANPHCFCSIAISFVMRVAFSA